jgi:hypothetical protein
MFSSPLLLFTIVSGYVFGAVMLIAALPRLDVASDPVVSGRVVHRRPISEWGIPRAEFTIEIPGEPQTVQARTQRYLLKKIPVEVRFHYAGDPSQLVYLYEHEEHPLWIGLTCWACATLLALFLFCRIWWSRSDQPAPMDSDLWPGG